jgi:hypothetical protein
MEMKLAVALVLVCAVSAIAQTPPAGGDASKVIATSTEYPLLARIIAVEMRTASTNTKGVSADSNGNVSGGGGGGTYTWHLMKAVIGDKLYGLAVLLNQARGPFGIPLGQRAWLEVGSYPVKRVKNGFEFQYSDDKGKVRHELLVIQSEEPYSPEPGK